MAAVSDDIASDGNAHPTARMLFDIGRLSQPGPL